MGARIWRVCEVKNMTGLGCYWHLCGSLEGRNDRVTHPELNSQLKHSSPGHQNTAAQNFSCAGNHQCYSFLVLWCPLPKTSLLWAAQTGALLWPRTQILILKLLLKPLIIGTSKNELPSPRWVDIPWILIWPVLHPNCHVCQAVWLLMSFLSSTSLYFLLSTSKLCRIMKCSLFHLRAHPLKNVTTKEDKGWLRMNNEQ